MAGAAEPVETPPPGRRVALASVPLHASRGGRRTAGYAIAVAGTVALTGALVPFRESLAALSIGFGYLIVVVAATAVGGLGPGILASVGGFVTFNFFFIPPYDTFVIARAEHVVVLFVFLGLAILISALLARAQERADTAEHRRGELELLLGFSAELVKLVPGPAAYTPVLRSMMDHFGSDAGAVFVVDAASRALEERVAIGCAPGELSPSWDPRSQGTSPERLPLSVGGRSLGLLVLRRGGPPLSPDESRVLRAFCDQFALVLERDRLLLAATETEVLRQADEVRRGLLAAVSHDLRSPLAAIKTSVTDLLSHDAVHDRAYVEEALEAVDREADRLNGLIANLLDMSRIEGGALKARLQGVDLSDLLVAVADRVSAQWPEVDVSVSDGAPAVQADPVFLERVLTNLLENAARAAMDGDHRVEVSAASHEGLAIVRVVDHGPGVPARAREQLFYPFYTVTGRDPRLGTGLGLAIAKGFLTLMAGDVWIEDTSDGGATFVFSLPLAQSAVPAGERVGR